MGIPPQEVVMTAHNHMTNLFILSYRGGLLLLNLGSKSNSVIEVDRALLHRG